MKEENEKEQIRERRARSQSAQRYDPQQTNCDGDDSKTSSLPGYGRNGLHRPQSTDFTQYNSHGNMCGGGREFQVCCSFAYPQMPFIMHFHFACVCSLYTQDHKLHVILNVNPLLLNACITIGYPKL
uniref:Putative adherens-junction anchoring domain-containing protein n=1 Tax=Hucho hucho TaxID=62062 RepID=A0A4W5NCW7_9TELE